MASNSTCSICKRGPQRANTVSHAKNRAPRRQKINVHMRKLATGAGKVPVCTKCTRTMSRVK